MSTKLGLLKRSGIRDGNPRNEIDHEDASPTAKVKSEERKGHWPSRSLGEDNRNPYIWAIAETLRRKTLNIHILNMLRSTIASSSYTPAVTDVMRTFNVFETAPLLPLSRRGIRPALAAHLSDKFGRAAMHLISLSLFAPFIVGARASQTFGGLVACRLLASVLASQPVVDSWLQLLRMRIFGGQSSDRYNSCVVSVFRPRTWVVTERGWRWTQWIILFSSSVPLAAYRGYHHPDSGRLFLVPENPRFKELKMEHRLNIARIPLHMTGSLELPTGLLWFAWTAKADVNWISPGIAAVFIA
ncbi:Major facilitator superfamily domain general substrate transporter protein [Rutstroemia sp. NJR-2017a BVV2]|nr:Major facilitator superfamily domain general substrate transporter protein [Rutstroemia sp. NJR-2017a BVV2]